MATVTRMPGHSLHSLENLCMSLSFTRRAAPKKSLICTFSKPHLSKYFSSSFRNSARKVETLSRSGRVTQNAPRMVQASRGSGASYKSFAQTMAERTSPVLLYQAPPASMYILGCYTLGGMSLLFASVNFYFHYLYPVDGTPTWIPIFIGSVCVPVAIFGGLMVFRVRCLP